MTVDDAEPKVLPEIDTVLAPEIEPLVILTLVRLIALFAVITKLPASVPPEIVIPELARAPPEKVVPLAVIVFDVDVTKPVTLLLVNVISADDVIVPVTVVPIRLIVAALVIEP